MTPSSGSRIACTHLSKINWNIADSFAFLLAGNLAFIRSLFHT